jgi:hypothetical protein
VGQVLTIVRAGVNAEVQMPQVPVADYLTRVDDVVAANRDLVPVAEGLLVDVEVLAVVDRDEPPEGLALVVTNRVDVQHLPTVDGVDR